MIIRNTMKAKPFVKWAGGKTQLLDKLLLYAPVSFENYYEAFVGGGAFFLKLSSMNKIKKLVINDSNLELTAAYRAIKETPRALIEELGSGKYVNDEETFYKIRRLKPTNDIEAAARFIYLNRTAFNGLYRVNSAGEFNTPFGHYKNPTILDEQNLLAVHEALQKDEIYFVEFEQAVSNAAKNDFIYFDPPYQPISKTSSFTKYTQKDFNENDQRRLAECFKRLDKKGCFVMLSNSDSPLIRELYSQYNIHIVKASRRINANGFGRGEINEVIVTNYGVFKWGK
ncbi:DNA adenine methylase [Candidatus Micrarchaeota archaeon]|nr:DNA adenine methylase [Candidatus Micrarchaeota archaeon]